MEEQPLIVGGKTYISSRRAAQIFGYTNDYIGQLSRSGKICSIMVGRDRFIDYSSVSRYAEEKTAEKITLNGNGKTNGSSNGSVDTTSKIDETLPIVIPKERFAFLKFIRLEKYISRLAEIQGNEVLQTASIVSSSFDFLEKIDRSYLGFLNKVEQKIVSVWTSIRARTLAWLSPFMNRNEKEERVVVETVRGERATTSYPTQAISGLSEEEVRQIASQVLSEELSRTIDYTSSAAANNFGIVIRPGSGESVGDDELKESIRDSFSDEVSVSLDLSRSAGIIRPVFRSPTDDSYVFVIVPVNQ